MLLSTKRVLARAIKHKRINAGLSQEQLALQSDVDRTYVSQLERAIANPSLSILCRIAEVLNCELKDLIVESDKDN